MSESLNSLRYSRQNTCKQKPFFLFQDRRSKKKHRENMRYLKKFNSKSAIPSSVEGQKEKKMALSW